MDREKKGARPTDRAGALRAEPVPVSGKAAHPSRGQLPLIIRFGIRLAKFVAGAFAIGLASALAEHFLVGGRHYDLISKTDLAVYRGALNMLLVLWFFDLLRRATTVPAVAVLAFLDAAIFNLIVGNADAHGKNFSLLHQASGVSLAPFYDLLSTVAYPDLSPSLAMKIARRATIDEIGPTTCAAFAEDIGLAASFVRRRVREISDAVTAQVLPVSASTPLAALDASALKEYAVLISSRAERLARTVTT